MTASARDDDPARRRIADRRTVGRRLAVFGPTVIVVVMGVLSYVSLLQVVRTRDSVMHTRDVLDASSSLLTALLDAETGERGYLLTHDSLFLGPYATTRSRVDAALNTLHGLTQDNASQARRVDTLALRARARLMLLDSAIADEQRGREASAVAIVEQSAGRQLMEDVRGVIGRVQAEEEGLLHERSNAEYAWRQISGLVLVLGTALAAMLAFGVNRGFDRLLESRRLTLDDAQIANERLQEQALELEQQAETARSAAVAADAANRAKAAFLASMSHELRTPLQAALGFAQLMRAGVYGPVTEQQAEALERVERSQLHLRRLIDDILDFARLEAGHVRVDVEPVALAELVQEVVRLVGPDAMKKRLDLAVRLPSDGQAVLADRQRLLQILLNLVGNAIKFTPSGGRVSIEAAGDVSRVLVSVRDTGVGIPRERLSAVFEPFVQLDDALTRTAEGAGLGLSISRDLARAMGGDITVESEVGRGSTFTVEMPRAVVV